MQLPKVTEVSRLSAHTAPPASDATRKADGSRVNPWPSNQPPSRSIAGESAS
jgi:hypothetical protein